MENLYAGATRYNGQCQMANGRPPIEEDTEDTRAIRMSGNTNAEDCIDLCKQYYVHAGKGCQFTATDNRCLALKDEPRRGITGDGHTDSKCWKLELF